ncbi:murein biosynthesis integral membrane protein MurJ [Spirochaetota bacterium]
MNKKEVQFSILRNVSITAFLTFISRIFGLIRTSVIAFFLGTTYQADAFTIAFKIPNLLRRLSAEGALTAAFVPVFSDLVEADRTGNEEKRKDFFNIVFTFLLLSLVVIVLAGIIFSPVIIRLFYIISDIEPGKLIVAQSLLRIMFPYILFISLAALMQGVLNSYSNFSVPAFTPVLLNISIISFGYFLQRHFKLPSYCFAYGVLIGGILQFSFQLPWLYRLGFRLKLNLHFRHPMLKKMLLLMLPGAFAAGIYQINNIATDPIALSLGEGAASSLMYSRRLMELPLGIFAVSVATVILPLFSRHVSQGKNIELKKDIVFSFRLICIMFFPVIIYTLFLREDIVTAVFKRGRFDATSLAITSQCLFYHILGILFVALYRIILPIFYSFKDTKTPVKVAFIMLFINVFLAFYFSRVLKMHAPGIALSSSVNAFLNFIILFVIIYRRIKGLDMKPVLITAVKLVFSLVLPGILIFIIMKSAIVNEVIEKYFYFHMPSTVIAVINILVTGVVILPVYIVFLSNIKNIRGKRAK